MLLRFPIRQLKAASMLLKRQLQQNKSTVRTTAMRYGQRAEGYRFQVRNKTQLPSAVHMHNICRNNGL